MENFCEITFCQQIGSNKRHNQDALFNGEAVFQYKLKTAEKRLENRPRFIVGVADGISNSNRPEKASKLAMQLLSQMESISRQTIYNPIYLRNWQRIILAQQPLLWPQRLIK